MACVERQARAERLFSRFIRFTTLRRVSDFHPHISARPCYSSDRTETTRPRGSSNFRAIRDHFYLLHLFRVTFANLKGIFIPRSDAGDHAYGSA